MDLQGPLVNGSGGCHHWRTGRSTCKVVHPLSQFSIEADERVRAKQKENEKWGDFNSTS